MARRTFSKLRRTALTLTLLLASQLSLAGQISDMVGVSATEHASLAEQAHSWVSPERLSISDEGCRVACQSKEFICIPRGGATISAVLPGESPTFSPALAVGAWPGDSPSSESGRRPTAATVTAHPPFTVLFCRYLN
jgi:hypothetical protein